MVVYGYGFTNRFSVENRSLRGPIQRISTVLHPRVDCEGPPVNKRERDAKEAADKVIDAAAARIVKSLKEIRDEQQKETTR